MAIGLLATTTVQEGKNAEFERAGYEAPAGSEVTDGQAV